MAATLPHMPPAPLPGKAAHAHALRPAGKLRPAMERLRTPHSPEDSPLETLHALPAAPDLRALLEAVSSPGVVQEEVDALVRALARPLAAEESPRARADFLHSVLEATRGLGLKANNGRNVRVLTVEALLALGFPYALEVPPEVMDEVSRDRDDNAPRDIPRVGIGAALVAMIAQAILFLPSALDFLVTDKSISAGAGLFVLGAIWGPPLSALLGGWLRSRSLQRLGLLTMALTGTIWLTGFGLLVNRYDMNLAHVLISLTSGLSLVGGAVLLRNPGWLARQKK